jgi:hypothetical protein
MNAGPPLSPHDVSAGDADRSIAQIDQYDRAIANPDGLPP